VQAAPFLGTPSTLLTRINKINADLNHARGRDAGTTGRYAVKTREGAVGTAEDFTGVARDGSLVAFVFRPKGATTREGVEIVAAGPPTEMAQKRGDIVSMIRSIRTAP
jgi:hypothetical protein